VRLGLIVNPRAGIGGPLALKGSDGALAGRALAQGAQALAGQRAVRALTGIGHVEIFTASGAMGQAAALAAGHQAIVVHQAPPVTTAADTVAAARAVCAAGIDLLVFAGGDGTARDLLGATGVVPVLGIPAGVKMHSAVFATSPAAAAALLGELAAGQALRPLAAEIIDRAADGAATLFGLLPAPQGPRRQAAKAAGPGTANADLSAACAALARELTDCPLAIIGTGGTMLAVKQALAGDGTLLGVDVYAGGQLLARDADEGRLWQVLAGTPVGARLVLGVIGGQGFLLGRGNQQLSARIIRAVGRPALTILAGADKLAGLAAGQLLVDSGDEALDQALAGHIAVRTGPRRQMMMAVVPA
jgi:predicted polyphosphate/ATP-dependent NAD kinase